MAATEENPSAIPVIDISKPSQQVAQQVLDAASTHGFLYIKNDGVTIPPQDIDDMFKLVCCSKRAKKKLSNEPE
jgi:isopenicillin N synthase-like dioxygenase